MTRATLLVHAAGDRVAGRGAACGGESGARRTRIDVRCATRALERLIGLIGQPLPAPGTGVWIEPCRAVHTVGVRGALDVVFVSRNGLVERVCTHVPPRRVRWSASARAVLELRAGEADRLGVRRGAYLCWNRESKGAHR